MYTDSDTRFGGRPSQKNLIAGWLTTAQLLPVSPVTGVEGRSYHSFQ